jgi:hypothetical protein
MSDFTFQPMSDDIPWCKPVPAEIKSLGERGWFRLTATVLLKDTIAGLSPTHIEIRLAGEAVGIHTFPLSAIDLQEKQNPASTLTIWADWHLHQD